jgi:hypothetical protein
MNITKGQHKSGPYAYRTITADQEFQGRASNRRLCTIYERRVEASYER